jgi:hypothetical protein
MHVEEAFYTQAFDSENAIIRSLLRSNWTRTRMPCVHILLNLP